MSQRSGNPSSRNRGSQHTVRPLSLGNVLSASFTLYRSHLQHYLGMSLKAHAWGLIPVYGWAKFHALRAAIAKNAFCDLMCQPESVKQSQDTLLPKMWGFFVIQLLLGVILFAAQIAFNVASNLLLLPFQFSPGFDPSSSDVSALFIGLIGLLFSLAFVLFFVLYLWLAARLFVPEVAYAVEEETEMVQALERSWRLTRGKAAWQVVLMMCIVIVIVTPLYVMAFLPPLIVLVPAITAFSTSFESQQAIMRLVSTILLVIFLWILLFAGLAIVVMPMWQTLKAAIYYDVRVRQEGMGLELRDRPTST